MNLYGHIWCTKCFRPVQTAEYLIVSDVVAIWARHERFLSSGLGGSGFEKLPAQILRENAFILIKTLLHNSLQGVTMGDIMWTFVKCFF